MRWIAPALGSALGSALLTAPAAWGQIELSQDFDSGSLDVDASVVDGDAIALAPRFTWQQQPWNTSWRWVHFRAENVDGLAPEFAIPAFSFLGSLQGHRFVYSSDRVTWSFFDTGAIGEDGIYRFQNDTPFAGDVVYVAYGLPYPVWRTEMHTAAVATSPFAFPTASADAALVIGLSGGGEDDTGREVPPQSLYAYLITDPDAGPVEKQRVVLAGGNHSGENPGNFVLEGLVDFLLGDEPEAAAARAAAEFYVYPQVDPDGRYGGYFRSNPENPDKDHNRFWNDTRGFTDLAQLTGAMVVDTGGAVDLLFDFHGFFDHFGPDFAFMLAPMVTSDFMVALGRYEPEIYAVPSNGQPGMLRIWGMSEAGLNATFAYTPEFDARPGRTEADYLEIGRHYGLAIHDTLLGLACLGDTDFDGTVGVTDLTEVIVHWGTNHPPADLNNDLTVDIDDLVGVILSWGACD